MLLLWHEALGSDDEQATEDELCARVLYSQDGGGNDEQLLQSLHFVQGLLTFVRMLRRVSKRRTTEWASVTLSKRKFFLLEVEPQIFMALGVYPTVQMKDHRAAYEALIREMYDMFRLFHGNIDNNLRWLPRAKSDETPLVTRTYADGMDLLMDIAATRKRLRKLRLAIDSHVHNQPIDVGEQDDSVITSLQKEKLDAEAQLEALAAQSPASRLQRKCADFFPTLLQALDARGTNGFSELQGLGYFPMDQPTFLALQTFVNGFHMELKSLHASGEADEVESSALFYKGNLLWNSMATPTMHLLYKFLRLREERGMTMLRRNDAKDNAEMYPDTVLDNTLWMNSAYEDTFLPVWSCKLSYAECDAVSQTEDGLPHKRRAARSLHKQHPVSLSTFLSETPPSSGGINLLASSSTPRSGVAAETSPFGSPSHSPVSSSRFGGPKSNGASPASAKNALKARARSISFRNAGFMLQNGCFSKLLHVVRETQSGKVVSETEAVWSPPIFSLDSTTNTSSSAVRAPTSAMHRVVVWHEADLTMMVLLQGGAGSSAFNAVSLERLEEYLDNHQRFQNLAQLIFTRYNSTFAPEKSMPNPHPLPPFLYINRVNLAFRIQHVPRLLKSKEDDMFPVPAKLLAHYFPSSTLALVNDLHAELHKVSNAGNREICVRTRHAGWVLAKKSETSHRELYVFFDSKISSVYDLSDSLQILLQDQFGNVLF